MKKLYKRLLRAIEKIPDGLEKFKTFAAEWVAIYRKRPLYKDIKWTKQQQAEFDAFWKKHYGKKISNRWHRLYEACNGVHRVDYMPEWIYSVKLDRKWNNRKYCAVYADKNLLGLLLDGRVEGVRTPKVYLFNCNGCFYDGNRNIISAERAKEIMASVEEAVIKPSVDSSSGHGVAVLNMQDGKNLRDGKTVDELFGFYKQNFCVQEKIRLCQEMAKLHPSSVNTFRVITYVVGTQIYAAPLSMRIGGGGSEVDNIHSGGVSIYVRNDGTLSQYAYRLGYGDSFEKHAAHPDTKVVFGECKLAFVEQMLDKAKRLHGFLPNLGMISWDFTVDSNGDFVVLEMNLKGQSVWFPQMLSGESMFGENTAGVLAQNQ